MTSRMASPIPIFIGYDYRERAATNVLIDSLYQNSTTPLSITPLITTQLQKNGIYWRNKDPKQSTEFTFTRFLVPYLMGYKGWAIFMDCDMLSLGDITELWKCRDDRYPLMCVQHDHKPKENTKFQGEIQTSYPRKNWSSLMLLNCNLCTQLTLEYVNSASPMELHRFQWLSNDQEVGELDSSLWNYLIGVDDRSPEDFNKLSVHPLLVHWTLGGPWFKDQRMFQSQYSYDWFVAREDSMRLWD